MLVAKQTMKKDGGNLQELKKYPSLIQWLQVVGINENAIEVSTYGLTFSNVRYASTKIHN